MLAIQKSGQTIRRVLMPSNVSEAVRLLADLGDRARLIAGGTDLMVELERNQRPGVDTLIDISRVNGLDQIELTDTQVVIGAGVTHNQVVGSDLVQAFGLPLAQACWEVGSPQLRNRATVAGNLVTASPANDTITPLMALGATLSLLSVRGERVVPLADFYRGVRQTVIEPDELLTKISFDKLVGDERGLYVKLGLRKAQAISVVHLTVILTLTDGIVSNPRIALGSVAPVIVRAKEAEAYLNGRQLDADTMSTAAEMVAQSVRPISDLRGTADYRHKTLSVMVRRTLETLYSGLERSQWPSDPVLLSGGFQAGDNRLGSRLADIENDDLIQTTINGEAVSAPNSAGKTLLRWMREDVQLPSGAGLAIGTKEGCSEGECGACTCFMDGHAVLSCLVPAARAHQADITTIEGLETQTESKNPALHPLQQAFIDTGAVQCGYCIPGFLMSGAKLLEQHPNPSREQILQAFSGNLCRCTGYYKIIEAVEQVAAQHGGEA